MRTIKEIRQKHKESGFTLVEMAIVLTLVTIIMVPIIQNYHIYMKDKARRTTTNNMAKIDNAIQTYFIQFKRFPCPSMPSTLASVDGLEFRDSGTGGLRPDPIATSACGAPPGITGTTHGTVIDTENSLGDFHHAIGVFYDKADATAPIKHRPKPTGAATGGVYIGGIPYADLNLAQQYAYDGYGNRIVYAVSDKMTVTGFSNSDTSIVQAVFNYDSPANNLPFMDDTKLQVDNLQYTLLSAGPDGMGGQTQKLSYYRACSNAGSLDYVYHSGSGTYRPPSTATNVWPNSYIARANLCRFRTNDMDGFFIHYPTGGTVIGGKTLKGGMALNKNERIYYDDLVIARSGTGGGLWTYSSAADMYNSNKGYIGINTHSPENVKVDVLGDTRAARINTPVICNTDTSLDPVSNVSNCNMGFSVESLTAAAMKCSTGVMNGIRRNPSTGNLEVVCDTSVKVNAPSGANKLCPKSTDPTDYYFLKGFNSSGVAICGNGT